MEQKKVAAKTLGVVRYGPLAMRATWEILPVRMLRLLLEIERAEKARASIRPSTPAATRNDLTPQGDEKAD
jgi:hypothetical protein